MAEKKPLPIERRKYFRIVESCLMTFITGKGLAGEGEVVDISVRGMAFLSETALTVGEKLRTVFILSNGISLDLKGIVRHRRGRTHRAAYGLEFSIRDHRDLKEHMKINDFIAKARAEQDRLLKDKLLKKK